MNRSNTKDFMAAVHHEQNQQPIEQQPITDKQIDEFLAEEGFSFKEKFFPTAEHRLTMAMHFTLTDLFKAEEFDTQDPVPLQAKMYRLDRFANALKLERNT